MPIQKAQCAYFAIRLLLAADPDWVERNCPGGIKGARWQLERFDNLSLDRTKEEMESIAQHQTLVRDLAYADDNALYESALARTRARDYPSEDD